jgi:hypothetical protein
MNILMHANKKKKEDLSDTLSVLSSSESDSYDERPATLNSVTVRMSQFNK